MEGDEWETHSLVNYGDEPNNKDNHIILVTQRKRKLSNRLHKEKKSRRRKRVGEDEEMVL